jgi:disulfide bond formation protein DsbB
MTVTSKNITNLNTGLIIAFVASLLALAGAYGAEYLSGIKPCILCVYQRYVYMVITLITLTGLILNSRMFFLLSAFSFLGEAGIAFYHVGVEKHIFELPSLCQTNPATGSIQELKSQLLHKTITPCDQIAWEFLGISMAGYNGIFSILLFLICMFIYSRARNNDPA